MQKAPTVIFSLTTLLEVLLKSDVEYIISEERSLISLFAIEFQDFKEVLFAMDYLKRKIIINIRVKYQKKLKRRKNMYKLWKSDHRKYAYGKTDVCVMILLGNNFTFVFINSISNLEHDQSKALIRKFIFLYSFVTKLRFHFFCNHLTWSAIDTHVCMLYILSASSIKWLLNYSSNFHVHEIGI